METKNIKILAIDDNQDNLITIKALVLETFPDAHILTATSGKIGLEIAFAENPDVILLDIIMPEMDGFTVCEILKADQNVRDIPVVFITALKGDRESRIRALEVGGEAFLAKPIDESELAAQIRAMVKIKAIHLQKQSNEEKLVTMVAEKTRELKENHIATLNLLEDLKTENEARRSSEKALIESELKFRTLMDNSPEGITIYANGKIVYVNKETVRMMGATDANDLLGATIIDFIHPDNRELVLERMKMVAMAPINAILPSVEEKYVRLDGTEFDVEIKVMPIFYEGQPAIQLSGHDITNRKIAERRVNESEEKYRLMFTNNPQPMFIYDLDTLQFIEVNLSAIELYGYSRDEFLAMSLLDIRPKEDIQPFKSHLELVNNNSTTRNLEWRHLKKSGEIIHVEATATSLSSNNRRERHVLINDITARKLAEEKLHESEQKFREMANLLPQVIFEMKLSGEITYVNQQTKLLFGYEADELIGQNSLLVHIPEEKERVLEGIKSKLACKPFRNNEFNLVRKNGSQFPALIFVNIISKDGQPVGIRGVVVDISEQRKSEENIRKSEALYRGVLEASPDSIIITDLNARIEMVSAVTISKLGHLDDTNLIGRNLSELVHEDDVHRMITDFNFRVKGKKTGPNEYKVIKGDGSFVNIEVNGGSILNEKAELSKLVFVARDITERKAIQDLLIESEYRYNSFINNNIDRIFVKDEECRYLIVNDAMADFFGKSKAEIINKTDSEIADENLVLPCRSSDLRALEADSPFILEEYIGNKIFETIKFPMNLKNNKKGIGGIMRDITDRKQAEAQLMASEEKYRTIIDNSNDLIWMLDINGNFTYINDQTTASTGIQLDEWKGKSFIPHIFEVDLPYIMDIFHRTLHGENCKYQLRLRRTENEIMYLSVTSSPIFVDGKIEGIINFARDITARKQIEAELERNRQELRTIYDNAPVMMCVIDENTKIQFGNKAFEQLSSTIDADINGQQVGNAIGCLNSFDSGCGLGKLCKNCKLRNAMANTLKTGLGNSNIEHKTSVIRGGELIEITLLASTALIDNGESKNLLLCLHDITEMKRAEENLKELGDSYFGLFNTVQHAIFIQNPDMSFMDLNQGAVDMCGYNKEFIIGKNPDIIAAKGLNNFQELNSYVQLASAGIPQQYEFWGKHKDGTIFPMEVWTLKGKYFGKDVLITLANDISERKATEMVLKENESRLNIMFEFSPIAIWEEDFSEVKNYIDSLKSEGIDDLNVYFDLHPEAISRAIELIKVLAINNKNNEIFGTTSTDEILNNIKHYFYANDLISGSFKDEIIALAQGQTSFECETQLLTQQGELKYLYLNLIVIPGFENSLSKVLVSFVDITERKQAEDALQKSEMFLRTFIENTPFQIWARDTNNVGILENKKMVEHFGSILGKTPENNIDDKKIVKLWKSNNTRVFGGEVIDEETVYNVDGINHIYQQIIFPIFNNKNIIGIAGFNIDITERKRAEEALRNSQEQLKNFSAHLQTIREEEKIALAREIHDDLGQILVALKIDMGMLKQKMAKDRTSALPNETQTSIDDMMTLIENTIRTTRRIMNGLRPEQLEILGFVDAVKQYLLEFEERHCIRCKLVSNVSKIDLGPQKTLALFRILQESMTNVARHSKASKVQLSIIVENDTLKFTISDNGEGFDMTQKAKMTSYGMIGMYERVTLVDGKLTVKSSAGKGTSIAVEITTL